MDGAPVEYQDPPDLSVGVSADSLPDGGMLAGQVGGEPVLLARRGEEVFALSSSCTAMRRPSPPVPTPTRSARRTAAAC